MRHARQFGDIIGGGPPRHAVAVPCGPDGHRKRNAEGLGSEHKAIRLPLDRNGADAKNRTVNDFPFPSIAKMAEKVEMGDRVC